MFQMIRVTCALIESDGRLLCARRSPTMSHPGKWEFPGGKIEEGETEDECLIREIREELGVEVQIVERLGGFPHTYANGFSLELIPFRCQLIQGTPVAREHDALCWLSVGNLWDLDWAGADVPVVRHYLSR
ncbi:MAG: (deoxy)nucleoside triphosphate pyrophosphohydrolase [Lewinellaceae bacterium]|nr:(deoxy)nucleoside triphosphate pyrophosphohydrolase [Lewinellaceae bacterium]